MASSSMDDFSTYSLDLRDMDESGLTSRSASYPAMFHHGSALPTGIAAQHDDDYLMSRWSQTAKFLRDLTVRKTAISDEIRRYRSSLLDTDHDERLPARTFDSQGPLLHFVSDRLPHPPTVSLPSLQGVLSEPMPSPLPGPPRQQYADMQPSARSNAVLPALSDDVVSASLDVLLQSVLQRSSAVSTKLVQSCALPPQEEEVATETPRPLRTTSKRFMPRNGHYPHAPAGVSGTSMRSRYGHPSQHTLDGHSRPTRHHAQDQEPRGPSNAQQLLRQSTGPGDSPPKARQLLRQSTDTLDSPPLRSRSISPSPLPSPCRPKVMPQAPPSPVPPHSPVPELPAESEEPELQREPAQPDTDGDRQSAAGTERKQARRRGHRASSSGCKLPRARRHSSASRAMSISHSMDGSPVQLPGGPELSRLAYVSSKPARTSRGVGSSYTEGGGGGGGSGAVHLPRLFQGPGRVGRSIIAAGLDARAAEDDEKAFRASPSGSSTSGSADVLLQGVPTMAWQRPASVRLTPQSAVRRSGSGHGLLSPTGQSSWAKSTTARELVFIQF